MTEEHHRYVPDHAVPMTMEKLIKSTSERVGFGTLDVVRVQIMGIVTSIDYEDGHVDFELKDDASHVISVQKLLTATFTIDQSSEIQIGDCVEVFGKVRQFENDKIYLNAFSIRKSPKAQYMAFKHICAFADDFYKYNSPVLPQGMSTSTPGSLGLRQKLGSLNRFPISMLEESSSVENNLGVWPKELENLAAEMTIEKKNEDSQKPSEDSFDVGPIQKAVEDAVVEDVAVQDDSFDAIP